MSKLLEYFPVLKYALRIMAYLAAQLYIIVYVFLFLLPVLIVGWIRLEWRDTTLPGRVTTVLAVLAGICFTTTWIW